jgi:hypothetical protein
MAASPPALVVVVGRVGALSPSPALLAALRASSGRTSPRCGQGAVIAHGQNDARAGQRSGIVALGFGLQCHDVA